MKAKIIFAIVFMCLLVSGVCINFFRPVQAATMMAESADISFKDMVFYDISGGIATYEEECLGKKTVIIVGRPLCSNTTKSLSMFNTYFDAVLQEDFKVVFLDVEDSQNMREAMKELPGYRNIQFCGTENAYYENYLWDKLWEMEPDIKNIVFPAVFFVDEKGDMCQFYEGKWSEREVEQCLKDFCGTENIDVSKKQGDIDILTSEEISRRILKINKKWFTSNPTEEAALEFYKHPDERSQEVAKQTLEIIKGIDKDAEKVRAIYDWITEHILYDENALEYRSWTEVLDSGTGNMKDYALLFGDMLKTAGIPCRFVQGKIRYGVERWTKELLESPYIHEWNELYYEGEWHIFDVALDCKNMFRNNGVNYRAFYDCPLETFSEGHWIWDSGQKFVYRPQIVGTDAKLDGNYLQWNLDEATQDSIHIRRREEGSETYEIIGWIKDGKQYHVTKDWGDGRVTGNYVRDILDNDFVDYYFVPGKTYFYDFFEYSNYASEEKMVVSSGWNITDFQVEETADYELSCNWSGGSKLYEYKVYEKAPGGTVTLENVYQIGDKKTIISNRKTSGEYEYWLTAWDTNTNQQVYESNHVIIQRGTSVSPVPSPNTQKPVNNTVKATTTSKKNTASISASGSTPGTAKLLSVKNKKARLVSVKIKQTNGATGYVIQYSMDKKFKKAKKLYSTKSITQIGGLKKKIYYFRVRTYLVRDGKKVYGKWSNVKKVKIKK